MKDRKSQFEDLARHIRSKSQQDALIWTPSNYINSYQTPLGNGVVLITHNEDEVSYGNEPIPEFCLAFINERGETIHSIEAFTKSDPQYELLKDIYYSAYDSYMRTDETYRSMMDAIMKL
ncbi:MAG: hypothetical protein K2N48_12640 [Muribaculaceae bacterium]|nr:hypothetical protein [Muribaculaceae bacterium]